MKEDIGTTEEDSVRFKTSKLNEKEIKKWERISKMKLWITR